MQSVYLSRKIVKLATKANKASDAVRAVLRKNLVYFTILSSNISKSKTLIANIYILEL